MEQSAKDCGCSPEDFEKQENTVLLSKPLCGAKKYYTQPHFCQFGFLWKWSCGGGG